MLHVYKSIRFFCGYGFRQHKLKKYVFVDYGTYLRIVLQIVKSKKNCATSHVVMRSIANRHLRDQPLSLGRVVKVPQQEVISWPLTILNKNVVAKGVTLGIYVTCFSPHQPQTDKLPGFALHVTEVTSCLPL